MSVQETKLLFDEFIFCLQRLYCVPFHLDLPFNDSILEEITTTEVYKRREHCRNCACTRTPTSGSEVDIYYYYTLIIRFKMMFCTTLIRKFHSTLSAKLTENFDFAHNNL